MSYMPGVKKRVNLARKIDKQLHTKRKDKSNTEWFRKAADEMGIDLDEVCTLGRELCGLHFIR